MANNSNERVLSNVDAVDANVDDAPNPNKKAAPNVKSINSSSSVKKFVLRLPTDLGDEMKKLSEHNHRSMNSEIIMILENHIQQNKLAELKDQNGIEAPQPDHEVSKRLEELKDALLDLMS